MPKENFMNKCCVCSQQFNYAQEKSHAVTLPQHFNTFTKNKYKEPTVIYFCNMIRCEEIYRFHIITIRAMLEDCFSWVSTRSPLFYDESYHPDYDFYK